MLKEKNNKFFEKKEIRKKCFLIRKQSAVNNYDSSFNAAKNFLSLVKIKSKDVIACYWPINNELDTRPLISFLSLKKIKIALPIIEKEKMLFKAWNIKEKLYFSKYKFYEPDKNSKTLSPNIIITPALAVDYSGNRIGYGAAFYDRYYKNNNTNSYVGFTYARQVFNTLPFTKHDLKLNSIVTDKFVKKIKFNFQ
jgi:5-formyltetrahydrofolate cyclo-ligase